MNRTHYAECDRANESDNNDYWSEYTACGLNTDVNEKMELSDRWKWVTCKNCIRRKPQINIRIIEHSTNVYRNIHSIFRRRYGKANRCESSDCDGISKRFDWALKKGHSYSLNRGDYMMLCRKCHMKGDSKRGNAHPEAKLTEEQVLFIRENKGKMTQKAMAEMFGVIRQTISLVLNNKNWKHVQLSAYKEGIDKTENKQL